MYNKSKSERNAMYITRHIFNLTGFNSASLVLIFSQI